jgi:hypothetical protein
MQLYLFTDKYTLLNTQQFRYSWVPITYGSCNWICSPFVLARSPFVLAHSRLVLSRSQLPLPVLSCPRLFSVVLACSRLSSPVLGCPHLFSEVLAHFCPSVKQHDMQIHIKQLILMGSHYLRLKFSLRSRPFARPFLCSSHRFSRSSCPSLKQNTIHTNTCPTDCPKVPL